MKSKLVIRAIVVVIGLLVLNSCATKKLTPLERGIKDYEAKDYAAAKTQFETILAADDSNPQALYYLGQIALQNGDLDTSIEHLKKAVSLDDTNSQYHFILGVAYAQKVQKGAYDLVTKLQSEFEKAVELDGNNLEARMGLSQFYMNAPPFAGGSEEKANEQIDAILKIDPVQGNLFMAQVHAAKQEYDEAEASFKAALEADPKNPDIYYQWGMMHQANKNYPAAFEAFERSIAINPTYMNGLYQMGRTALFAEDNLERGAECLKIYLKHKPAQGQPSLAHAHWRLGLIYEKMGKPDLAKKEYQAALSLKPDLKEAKEALEKL
jgi:tetratricopeptide (TPR) repeat protein